MNFTDLIWERGRKSFTQTAPFDEADVTDDFAAFYDKFPELQVTIRRYTNNYSIAYKFRNDAGKIEFSTFGTYIPKKTFPESFHQQMGELRRHLERIV